MCFFFSSRDDSAAKNATTKTQLDPRKRGRGFAQRLSLNLFELDSGPNITQPVQLSNFDRNNDPRWRQNLNTSACKHFKRNVKLRSLSSGKKRKTMHPPKRRRQQQRESGGASQGGSSDFAALDVCFVLSKQSAPHRCFCSGREDAGPGDGLFPRTLQRACTLEKVRLAKVLREG